MEMKERVACYQIHNKFKLAIFNAEIYDWQKKNIFSSNL